MKPTLAASMLLCALLMLAAPARCQPAEDGLHIRVVDVGQGLCCIVRFPGGQTMLYDAGSKNEVDGVFHAITQLNDLVPADSDLDLVVISHDHGDHQNLLPYLFCESCGRGVKKLFYPGNAKQRSVFRSGLDAYYAPDAQAEQYRLTPGDTFRFGDADQVEIQFIAGWRKPLDEGEDDLNETSLVLKLTFAGRSVLFTGDSCGLAHRFMVGETVEGQTLPEGVSVDADILIAPHHGSKTRMSNDFFAAVSPEYVVFPSGHWASWCHPKHKIARYFIDSLHVDPAHMVRTDWGDDEGCSGDSAEWARGRIPGHRDLPGDDHIDIWLLPDGTIEVRSAADE